MKTRYRRHSFHEMIDFPIGKRDFQVRAWSGAFWEPWREKKDKPKCIYSRPYRAKKSASIYSPEEKEHLAGRRDASRDGE